MTELTPAVLDAAYSQAATVERGVAAAFRAAADQMSYAGAIEAATWLTEIAAELEGQ